MLRAFERAHAADDITVEVESFTHIDEAVARLQDPASDFDIVFPVIDVLPGLVDAGLLRPLNHDYLPHVRNLWGWFRATAGRSTTRASATQRRTPSIPAGSAGVPT